MPQRDHFYSEQANEIMGMMPRWIIRWGITVIFVIFAGILIGCYFIKYPQTVTAPVVITTLNPPADLVARYEGRIDTIFIPDGQSVVRGQPVALLDNPADYLSVCLIESELKKSAGRDSRTTVNASWLEGEYSLGDLQNAYAAYQQICLAYRQYLNTDYIGHKKRLLEKQIAKNTDYYSQLLKQRRLLDRDMDFQEKSLRRDSLLYSQKVISSADYENSLREMLQKENSRIGFDATLTSTELSIMQTRQQLMELSMQQENESAEYERNLIQARQQLLTAISQWHEKYLLESPIEGRITYINYWSNNQRVQMGDRLASIIPADSLQVLGRMNIPSAGFGKVETGQTVNVKLNGYPYMEYGVLKGHIKSISAVPDGENGYVAEVAFPQGLVTTYRKELQFIQQMDGQAEIITKDMRLIEQFVQPIRAVFER